MTFFFAGEVLCELPPDQLREWHNSVKECFQKSNFRLKLSAGINEGVNEDTLIYDEEQDFYFQLRSISVFPPQRNDLIVAILEASPSWHALHRQVIEIGKQSPCEGI